MKKVSLPKMVFPMAYNKAINALSKCVGNGAGVPMDVAIDIMSSLRVAHYADCKSEKDFYRKLFAND